MREIKSEPKKKPKVVQTKGGELPNVADTNPKKNTVAGISALGSTSRIAQMIARISNQNPVSKNVVIVKNAKLGDALDTISAASVTDLLGGTTKGLGQIGGTTTGVTVGTLINQMGNGTGSGRGLASVANGLTGAGGSAAASALDEEADVEGGLDPELIANFIKSRLGEILYCYERQLSANPNLYGKVGVRFIIGSTGAVESSRIFQSSLHNSIVENCIIQKIGKWKFPQPKGGTQVVVTYPFLFKNTN
jgi:TonB family protein